MFKLENTSYKRVHEPDAGFIDNCSEFHQSISPIEEEVDKSGSSFLIAFNQAKSRSWTICNQRLTSSCLPSSTQQNGTASDWKMEKFSGCAAQNYLELIRVQVFSSRAAAGVWKWNGPIVECQQWAEGEGESVWSIEATDFAGLEHTESLKLTWDDP